MRRQRTVRLHGIDVDAESAKRGGNGSDCAWAVVLLEGVIGKIGVDGFRTPIVKQGDSQSDPLNYDQIKIRLENDFFVKSVAADAKIFIYAAGRQSGLRLFQKLLDAPAVFDPHALGLP